MSEIVTLKIPDSLMEQARTTAQKSGQAVEDVLMGWLAQVAKQDSGQLLEPGREYMLYSPEESPEAARVLEAMLN
jgi:hypothetical protein